MYQLLHKNHAVREKYTHIINLSFQMNIEHKLVCDYLHLFPALNIITHFNTWFQCARCNRHHSFTFPIWLQIYRSHHNNNNKLTIFGSSVRRIFIVQCFGTFNVSFFSSFFSRIISCNCNFRTEGKKIKLNE